MTKEELIKQKKQLGGFITKAINAEGVSYYDIRQKSGVHQNVVQSIEQGDKQYTFDSLLKLLDYFNLQMIIKQK